jgi:hypothetical protein
MNPLRRVRLFAASVEHTRPSQLAARLRLIRSEQIGPITFAHLLARFGSAQAAIDAIPDLAARGGGRAPRLAGANEFLNQRGRSRCRWIGIRARGAGAS